ncbi:MAG: hypothetical protein BWY81_00222 [Firmicutes bacterium ADurb.Bin467]|nr:MAG: hypothetical protein BWY81_00222 [Firmicutes bacterium ADurb.Bin467]
MSSTASGHASFMRSSIESNAPLTIAIHSPSISWTVVINFRSESNGTSASRGYLRFSAAFVMPFL